MTVDYYIINDPETVKDGITSRSAIAGFFYRDTAEALDTKRKLEKYIEVANNTTDKDILSDFYKVSQNKSNKYSPSLPPIKKIEGGEEDVIEGNTMCYVVYDTVRYFPDLGLEFPSKVFVKLYHYSSRTWEMHSLLCCEILYRKEYYDMFFNELLINEKISESPYASNFPKLLASGY